MAITYFGAVEQNVPRGTIGNENAKLLIKILVILKCSTWNILRDPEILRVGVISVWKTRLRSTPYLTVFASLGWFTNKMFHVEHFGTRLSVNNFPAQKSSRAAPPRLECKERTRTLGTSRDHIWKLDWPAHKMFHVEHFRRGMIFPK